MIGSNEVESFLSEVKRKLLGDLDNDYSDKVNIKTAGIHNVMKKLKREDVVVVPTDKTNSFRVVDKEKYVKWVEEHISTVARAVLRDRIQAIFNKAKQLL